jgi:hypothetical protein
MAINLGNVTKTGDKYKQITTFQVSGKPGDAPESYNVALNFHEFEKFEDGVRITNRQTIGDSVSNLLLDNEGELDTELEAFMGEFITKFYELLAKMEARQSE